VAGVSAPAKVAIVALVYVVFITTMAILAPLLANPTARLVVSDPRMALSFPAGWRLLGRRHRRRTAAPGPVARF